MATRKLGSGGIFLENCEDVEMSGNRFIGIDTAIHAVNSRNIRAHSNTIVSREVVNSIATRDKAGLIAALGLPAHTPSPFIGDALQAYARSASNEHAAAKELSESRLARYVGVAADLTQLVEVFAGLARSPMLASAVALLLS